MGWFGNKDTMPTQQFGAPTMNGMNNGMNSMGGMNGMGMMDQSMMGMQMAQNPMMQQMANDPVTATARLLALNGSIHDYSKYADGYGLDRRDCQVINERVLFISQFQVGRNNRTPLFGRIFSTGQHHYNVPREFEPHYDSIAIICSTNFADE